MGWTCTLHLGVSALVVPRCVLKFTTNLSSERATPEKWKCALGHQHFRWHAPPTIANTSVCTLVRLPYNHMTIHLVGVVVHCFIPFYGLYACLCSYALQHD
ncbi:hypothetical protein COO60DRAFT_1519746 [Scenedesmus sp. NREL 46B-D3]|nr:hypothetical protein COO60DRAFT_1519746 [Scenedesmus sp. NREL 46B-D3]